MSSKIKFIDLFSGTGGIRLALEQVANSMGFEAECVFSSEIDPDARETYRLNFKETPKGDIHQYREEIPSFDFLLAGFPCQPFSYAGKRMGFGDTRGTLFFEIERILNKHKPRGFLLENVRGLTTHDGGKTLKTILHSLNELGYATKYVLCNSSNFGVPQNRVRIYILGVLDKGVNFSIETDLGASDSHAFKKVSSQEGLFSAKIPYRTVRDIIEHDVDEKYFCSDEHRRLHLQG